MKGLSGLISIVGPPACGKTTLAKSLAERLGANLILEDFQGNPFLASAFSGDVSAKLPAQLYFLSSRVRQLDAKSLKAGELFVSDYGFCQDAVYARKLLSGDELVLYERLSGLLADKVLKPRIVIALDARTSTLQTRIAQRGREYEKAFDATFLEAMKKAYNDLFSAADRSVMRVDCDAMDFRRAGDVEEIAKRLSSLFSE